MMIIKKVVVLIVFMFLFAWMLHLAGAKTFIQGLLLTYTYAIAKEGTLASVEATPGKADGGVASTIKPLDRDTAENIAGSATVTTKGSHAMVESVSSVVSDL